MFKYTNQVRLNDLIDNYVIAWYTSSTDGKNFHTCHFTFSNFFFEKVDGSQFDNKKLLALVRRHRISS